MSCQVNNNNVNILLSIGRRISYARAHHTIKNKKKRQITREVFVMLKLKQRNNDVEGVWIYECPSHAH